MLHLSLDDLYLYLANIPLSYKNIGAKIGLKSIRAVREKCLGFISGVLDRFRSLWRPNLGHFWGKFQPSLIPLPTWLIFIGPESDHWLPLSLTHKLIHCCYIYLIDVTLACEDANIKLVEVVTFADVDDEDGVGNSL